MEAPGNLGEPISIRSNTSLFDADIIIFKPSLAEYASHEHYAGERLLAESDSASIKSDMAHWRAELSAAVESGKTVLVMLTEPKHAYYYTGTKDFSGTGRSRVATKHVDQVSSYEAIPFDFENLVPRGGKEIAIMGPLGPLAAYWDEFGDGSEYAVYFDAGNLTPLLGTKNRERVVGGVIRTQKGGALLLLPPLRWDEDELTYWRGESRFWRKAGVALGHRLVTALVGASAMYKREGNRTPTPSWATAATYAIPAEEDVRTKLRNVEAEMKKLESRRKAFEADLEKAGGLRALLYETGKPLETATLQALELFGFAGKPFRDAESEFDAVLTSPEGRFLGEAEGKDNKAVNIDKITQLERNIQEDFTKEGVTAYAKGILFGNAYRLQPPEGRAAYFTDKCVTSAKRLHVALVRTPDLFGPARYLSVTRDDAYATACRQAICTADGDVVTFPTPPVHDGANKL